MKTYFRTLPVLILALALVLSSCSLPAQETAAPTLDIDIQYTQAAQTVIAQLTLQAAPSTPSDVQNTPTEPGTEGQTPAAPSDTPFPSETPQPSQTPPPTPTLTATACVDKVEFVEDVTIPDDSVVTPGQTFIKIWRLRNAGTCTWTKEYDLLFVEGEQMGAPAAQALTADVPPGTTVDLSISFKAPGVTGTYRSDWILRNAKDVNFGLGTKGDQTFYVRVKVEEGEGGLNLGNPDWRDNFDGGVYWYLLDTDNTLFEMEDGHLIMTSSETGGADEWGLSNQPSMEDYYLELTFKTGETCSGLDRYGVLVRAEKPTEGYVFGFSCDGRYRLYAWDGENYTGLQEWKSSAHILAGPNQTNKLGIWLEGDTIRLYANGKLLAELEDDSFSEGRFGVFISSAQTKDLVIYVEEAAYWNLED